MARILAGMLILFAALAVQADSIEVRPLPSLNQPVSNNAVTLVSTDQGDYLYSFLGLGEGL